MPRHNLPPLNSLSSFEAVARHMSFTKAALELRVTQGAISRQVRTLEDHLGVQLFERGTGGLRLTKNGEQLFGPTKDAFLTLELAATRLRAEADSDILTVNMFPTFAMKWFVPRSSRFAQQNPSIDLRLVTSIAPLDSRTDEFDVAIRISDLHQPEHDTQNSRVDLSMARDMRGLKSTYLMPDVLVPICSPALLKGNKPLSRIEDLRHHMLLHVTGRPTAWPSWLRSVGHDHHIIGESRVFGQFCFALQAALEGAGVAIVPEILVEHDLRTGTLVCPFKERAPITGAYYFLCREHHWEVSKVRRFRKWIMREVAAYR
jgi:LysR family glycine cleavage system transcriptional activator